MRSTHDADGRAAQISDRADDVADRQDALEALRESEAQFRMLFEQAPYGVVVVDPETLGIVRFNDAACRQLGYARAEFAGLRIADIEAVETQSDITAHTQRMLEQGADSFRTKHRTKGGDIRDVAVTVQVIQLGGRPFAHCIFEDVTEARRVEGALRASDAVFRQFVLEVPAAVAMFDREMRYLFASKRWLADYHLDERDVIGRSHYEVFPDIPDRWKAIHRRCLAGAIERSEDDQFVREGGEVHSLRWGIQPWRDGRGEVGGIIMFSEDISERKRAEEALRASEERIRYIIKHNPNAIAVYDNDLHYILVSDRYLQDYRVREKDIVGKHHYEVFPEIPERWREIHRRALAGEILSTELDVFPRSDGTVDYTRWECRPWYDLRGNIGGMITYTEVITERVRAAEALRESEQKHRVLFESSADAVFLAARADGRILDANAAASRTYGYSHDEFLALANTDISAEPDKTRLLMRGVPSFVPVRYHRKKDGTVFPVELAMGEMTLGDGRGVIVVAARDISERTLADQAIRRYNERLQVLQELDRRILAAQSADEIAEYVVQQVRTLVPCDRASIGLLDFPSGTSRVAGAAGDPALGDPIGTRRPIADASASFDDVRNVESTRYIPDLREIASPWPSLVVLIERGVRSLLAAPLIVDGRPLGIINVMSAMPNAFTAEHRDILRQIADPVAVALQQALLRRELQRQNESLEQRIAERTQALREVNAELNSFAYSVSHDLRAPLRALQGYSQILIEDHAEQLDEEGLEFAQRIRGAAQRMDRLVKDLLAFSRVTRAEIKVQPLDLGRVVDEALGQLEAQLAASGARVEVARPLPTVLGHQATLVQVVANLIGNGAKYIAPGMQPAIRISAEDSPTTSELVRLWVCDNGIGIAAENQERVFTAFERLHGVEEYPGSGLGLAIVKKGIERLGGRVGVESALGTGSRFWFELPRA